MPLFDKELSMRSASLVIATAFLCLAGASITPGQEAPIKNPRESDPASAKNGLGSFRARCAGCHGMDARGSQGPDLTNLWSSGMTDARLFDIVKHGIPGTEMPDSGPRVTDVEIWDTLSYLHSLNTPAASDAPHGDAAQGERIFRTNCSGCHTVDGRADRLGPDLSRIGSSRSLSALSNKIRGAGTVRPGYEPVTLVLRDGRRIQGVAKNEDAFSIQIMELSGRIQGYLKTDLQEVIHEPHSLMPVYGPNQLNDGELGDLLTYLSTLRGTESPGR
jgi:cytochrome c oxidase cbb3-type subunit III